MALPTIRLHLIRPFVGVERFAIRKEPRGLVIGDDTIAAEQLARPGDGLAALAVANAASAAWASVAYLRHAAALGAQSDTAKAVMLAIILASRSCTSWNEAIGLPNWMRSCAI